MLCGRGRSMQGARPFTADEVRQIVKSFSGRYQERNRALFLLGIGAGFRISEMLALRIKDVSRNGKVFPIITVQRRNMKGKQRSRTVELHPEVRAAINIWLEQMPKLFGEVSEDTPLFCSRVKNLDGTRRALARETCWRFLQAIYDENELIGTL